MSNKKLWLKILKLMEDVCAFINSIPKNTSKLSKNLVRLNIEFSEWALHNNFSKKEVIEMQEVIALWMDEMMFELLEKKPYSDQLVLKKIGGDSSSGDKLYKKIRENNISDKIKVVYAAVILAGFKGKFRFGNEDDIESMMFSTLNSIGMDDELIWECEK